MVYQNTLKEIPINCPYCGEQYDSLIDPSIEQQHYVEDCQICCAPIVFNIKIHDENELQIEVNREND